MNQIFFKNSMCVWRTIINASICCSAKFGRKVMYVNYLHELAQYLQLDQLIIPQRVKKWVSRDIYSLLP